MASGSTTTARSSARRVRARTPWLPPIAVGPHAVLWEEDGSVHDLGNLGGTVNTALPAVGNRALGINNQGQVVGGSTLPGNTTAHAFLWTKETGIRDLGTLPGDFNSGALSINDKGDVVGVSNDTSGGARAFLWQNGVMHDLNTLIPPNSPMVLLFAAGIDSSGQIAGWGVQKSRADCARLFGDTDTRRSRPLAGWDRRPRLSLWRLLRRGTYETTMETLLTRA